LFVCFFFFFFNNLSLLCHIFLIIFLSRVLNTYTDDERLHFEVGMRVEVNKGGRSGWVLGTIVQLTPESLELREELEREEQKRLAAEVLT
jgi:hypothetical protein